MTTEELLAELEDLRERVRALRAQIDAARPRWHVMAGTIITITIALVSVAWSLASARHKDLSDIDRRIDKLEIEVAAHIAQDNLLNALEKRHP